MPGEHMCRIIFLSEIWKIGADRKEAPPPETHALTPANQRSEPGIHQRQDAALTNQLHMSHPPVLPAPCPDPPTPRALPTDKYDPHLTSLVIPQLSFILHIINISAVKKKETSSRGSGGRFFPAALQCD